MHSTRAVNIGQSVMTALTAPQNEGQRMRMGAGTQLNAAIYKISKYLAKCLSCWRKANKSEGSLSSLLIEYSVKLSFC